MVKESQSPGRGDRALLPTITKETEMTEKKKVITEQDIQDWYDSGPIKPEMLQMWLDIIQQNKETK
jgi:enterochelin esterase-like enzyme